METQKTSTLSHIRGYILNSLINNRVTHPSLYTNNGSCRKWSVELALKHINKYK